MDARRPLDRKSSKRRLLIGSGLSFGSCQIAMSSALRPSAYSGLVLFEPIIYPNLNPNAEPVAIKNPMADSARRRKNGFNSLQDVYKNFKSKEFFKSWEDDAVWAYIKVL